MEVETKSAYSFYLIYIVILLINLLGLKLFKLTTEIIRPDNWLSIAGIIIFIDVFLILTCLYKKKDLFWKGNFNIWAFNCLFGAMLVGLVTLFLSQSFPLIDFLTLPAIAAPFISLGIFSVILSLHLKPEEKQKYAFKKEHLIVGLLAILGMRALPYFFKLYFPAIANIFSMILMGGVGGAVGGLIGWKLGQLIFGRKSNK